MPSHVLARKWRPQSFTKVIGQPAIVQALTHALESGRLHHAYLFSGTRGIGKTSLARLVAKCISCEQGPTATPCGQCNPCLAIVQGNYLDLLEIDAASRTKVEDTRELLESVQYPPIMGRYKIILIDEVHMLSGHSFNALLKPLEEPPKHVIFLLATTEPEKLPNTVLSRCLHFTLKPLSNDALTAHFSHILQQENILFEPNALALIARAARGSVRDGLSLLERCIAFCSGDVTVAKVSELLGLADSHSIQLLLDSLLQNDAASGLTVIRQLAEKGVDFSEVLEGFMEVLHQLALQQALEKNNYAAMSAERIQLYYQIALMGRGDLALAPDQQMGFEMLYIRLLTFQPWHDNSDISPTVKKKLLNPVTNPL